MVWGRDPDILSIPSEQLDNEYTLHYKVEGQCLQKSIVCAVGIRESISGLVIIRRHG
jgi:hypothetical protein